MGLIHGAFNANGGVIRHMGVWGVRGGDVAGADESGVSLCPITSVWDSRERLNLPPNHPQRVEVICISDNLHSLRAFYIFMYAITTSV